MFDSVRSAIRKYHPKYPVTAHMYPTFLYDNYYNLRNSSKGLFQGEYLVKVRSKYDSCASIFVLRLTQAFRCVFTSPSSAEEEPNCDEAESRQAKRPTLVKKTRHNVAQLLKMKTVDPRAIAYITCLVRLYYCISSTY